jgi:nucleotide-binding universal stress UspA family protein
MKKIVVAVDGSQQALQAARMGVNLATQMAAKLVLVHGRGAATRVLLGSVSDRLVHICDKPVMVVR